MTDDATRRGERRIEAVREGSSPVPLDPESLREAAADALDPGPAAFLFDGAGTGATMAANRRAFDRVQIRPKVLHDVSDRSLAVDVCGSTFDAPVMVAPIGVQSIWDDGGERATARAAANANVPYCLSTMASTSLEDVADVLGAETRWFQLYWINDRAVVESMVGRAEDAGYDAIVLTVDAPTMGWRTRILESGYEAFAASGGLANFRTDPAFRDRLDHSPQADEAAALEEVGTVLDYPNVTWDELDWLTGLTDLPVVLKGIRHPDDAERAAERVDGVVVSNHGGRQIDGELGSLEALPDVRDAVGGRLPVLFDGGIRTGADAFKAVALGADAVMLGRPCMYGLAVAGEAGARAVLENVVAEFDLTMALSGYDDVADVGTDAIRTNWEG